MANLRDIRNRIESIKNTQQITRAMKMVAAAKLRKAQNRIIETRPYASKMKEVVARLVKNSGDQNVLMRKPEKTENILFIVVSSDRGLCGAFNNNLFKKVQAHIEENFSAYQKSGDLSLVTLGKKATKHFGKRNYKLRDQDPNFYDDLEFSKVSEIMKEIVADFKAGEIDAVYLAYNEFKSVIAQNRIIEPVLPIDPSKLIGEESETDDSIDYIYEPGVESILDDLLPLHLNMQLWKAVLESNAAEQGARMTAMDNATENAKELERDLQLEYNQARQSAITTEISEIVSGAQALEEA
ncbi:ATP synthase F1 subunit gamma [Aliifodinibius sp. S!AR15-10]|uniref:ATP synthase F1 subunit gamma n=1 Tax=Aliifodinibius sp. S!AR15-10 TaxID=2950437 RepID=UPI00285E3D89|nr:ATP synthase F1 subunit gamma [Aliifodinibius sp. S!AR15-10]MDR8391126.1 ATP synthase F1 subunit gamma [Aliifodinibius sp. S!AR15-10]